MKITSIEKGIHTVELVQSKIGYHDIQVIVEDLFSIPKSQTDLKCKRNAFTSSAAGIDRVYESRYLSERGIRMELEQTISHPGRIRFIVNPSTFKNKEYDALALYKPKKDCHTMRKVVHKIDTEFGNWMCLDGKMSDGKHRDWKFNQENVTLSRIDLTWNLWFDEKVDLTELIRLFKKGFVPSKYKVSKFKDKESSNHSFRIEKKNSGGKSMTLTVYDKGYEISKHDADFDIGNTSVLRIEVSIFRKMFISWFNKKNPTDDDILIEAYRRMDSILAKLLRKVFPCTGTHLPYQKAEKKIRERVEDTHVRDQMLFILQKTSKRTLLYGLIELKERDGLTDSELTDLLLKFNSIDVNPITFKKDFVLKRMRPFLSLFGGT